MPLRRRGGGAEEEGEQRRYLTLDSMGALPKRDQRANIAEQVALGKKTWEKNDRIGCHTLLGEGAYFAPELGCHHAPPAFRTAAS